MQDTTVTQETEMTTIDQKSRAEQDELHTAIDPDAAVLECNNCGRNCRHLPNAGGGTAGGVKGQKYEPTPRSQLPCTSCHGKMHRKESRGTQEFMCLVVQAANKLGLTVAPRPHAAILREMLVLVESGQYREPPTEREVAHQIAIASGLIPEGTPLPERQKREPRETTAKQTYKPIPTLQPGEAITEGISPAPAIEIPDTIISAIKKKKSPEEIAAEKERAAEQRRAEREKAKLEREKAREEEKARKAKERAEAAARKLEEKAEALKLKAAGLTAAVSLEAKAPPEAHEPLEVEEADENGTFEDGYNPLLGTVLDGDETDDDDDEPELTPAQLAALQKK